MRTVRALSAVLVVAGVAACGEPTRPEPAPTLEIVDGFGQEGLNGGLLPNPLRVRLTRADGTPVEGASIGWTVSSGEISPAVGVTDASGEAAARWSFFNSVTRWWSAPGAHLATATAAGGDTVMFIGYARRGIFLRNVAITPDRVNVASSAASVIVTVSATDDHTRGLNYVAVQFINPTATATGFQPLLAELALASGTKNDGFWSGSIIVPQGAEAGDWPLRLTLDSGFGTNSRKFYFDTQLQSAGLPHKLTVAAQLSQPDALPGVRP